MAVEERLLLDEVFYQELLIVEDELIDEHLNGRLSSSEEEAFAAHFLAAPERHEKVRFARNLKKYVSKNETARSFESAPASSSTDKSEAAEPPPRKRSFFWFLPWGSPILSYSLATAVVLLLTLSSVFIVRNLINPGPSGTGKIWAVELTPGLSRGDGEIKQISVPSGTDTVQLDLKVASTERYQRYRAILQTPEGREILRRDSLTAVFTAGSGTLSFQVPVNLITSGDYSIKLSGLNQSGEYDDLGRYSFRVTGK